MKKTIIIPVVVVLLGALAFLAFRRGGNGALKYRTAKVDRGDVTQTRDGDGRPFGRHDRQGRQPGVRHHRGAACRLQQEVKKGALLAELDPTPFLARVAQSQATLDKARVDLRNAEIGLRRQAALKEQGLAPQADFDQAQANFDSARAGVAQAQAQLSQARDGLEQQPHQRAD